MKKIIFVTLLSASCLLNTSCDEEQVCSGLALCDLAFDIMSLAVPNVTAGIPFVLNAIVQNFADEECETRSAGQHFNNFLSVFRETPNQPWEQISFQDESGNNVDVVEVNTPSISAGGYQPINLDFTMNIPGQYMVMGAADDTEIVEERNENNNGAESQEGILSGLWIEGDEKDSSKRYLNEAILDNLVEGVDYIIIDVKQNPKMDKVDPYEVPIIKINSVTLD